MSSKGPERPGYAGRIYTNEVVHPYADLEGLAERNALDALNNLNNHGALLFRDVRRARKNYRPFSGLKEEPEDPPPKILLICRKNSDDRYFVAKPNFPDWVLTRKFLRNAFRNQTLPAEKLSTPISNEPVVQANDTTIDAKVYGILYTRFFDENRSDWEIVAKYLDPDSEFLDTDKPEVFTFRSVFDPVYNSWPAVVTNRHVDLLPVEDKGRLVEDLIGNTLQAILREVENRHVRQVASRLLLLHPFDPTHQQQFTDRVIYHMTNWPIEALSRQFLLAGKLAAEIVLDTSAPTYLPNYRSANSLPLGDIIVPDAWIKKTLRHDPINALGEFIYAASLARDDSNGRLRGFTTGLGFATEEIVYHFYNARERALVHTALFLAEVYKRDGKAHGIYPRLSGISKQAWDKYSCLENHLASQPILYDDPGEGNIGRGDPPPNRGPEDDLSLIPGRGPGNFQRGAT